MANLFYRYFNRDISWLSFNYRVLLESEDKNMPLYERIKFLAIHASNLEEFYKIRVSEHRGVILKKVHSEEDSAEAEQILEEIKAEVTRQQKEFSRIFTKQILPELKKENIILYQNQKVEVFHREFVRNYFVEEIFPFLQPVLILKDDIKVFIRDNRLYQIVKLETIKTGKIYYAMLKIPYAKVPRFIELPRNEGRDYYMFVEDIISANLPDIFPGFNVIGSYNVKISRDADIYIDEENISGSDLVDTIIKKVKKRKIGDLNRFVYDSRMPKDCLNYICETFEMSPEDLIPDNPHLSMEDLARFPNPRGGELLHKPFVPIEISLLKKPNRILRYVRNNDVFLHYPYHTFDHFLYLLEEASNDPRVEEIKITQYRVAQDSAVINSLIYAAKRGKKVTVFVELKARFDEENNLLTAEIMKKAGIRIIYSLPGLKVHAKMALITERQTAKYKQKIGYAYLSTGNFNEKTARLYSDMAILTSKRSIIREANRVFELLEGGIKTGGFKQLLVAQFNLIPQLKWMIEREIRHVKQGKRGRIVLKMNGMQDREMIDELYNASEAGVEIELIVRGICCIVPNHPFSKNIRITRIVDMFLEHSRIWYFYNNGKEDLYLTSADWLRRNLYRRIETAFPVLDSNIKQTILKILDLQLRDNVKACSIDEHLRNIFKTDDTFPPVWSQQETYNLLISSQSLPSDH